MFTALPMFPAIAASTLTGSRVISTQIASHLPAREKAQELTGCVIGSIPPFSFSDQLQVLADPLIQQNEEVVFNAGRLDRSIFMKLDDYIRIAKPQLTKIALRGEFNEIHSPCTQTI